VGGIETVEGRSKGGLLSRLGDCGVHVSVCRRQIFHEYDEGTVVFSDARLLYSVVVVVVRRRREEMRDGLKLISPFAATSDVLKISQ